MDGLECSEIKLNIVKQSNTYFRLESEYFNAPQINFFNTYVGEQIIDKIQYGTSNFLNEEGYGYPVLRLNEFESFFIKEPQKYCNLLSTDEYEELKLCKGDVLICRTNGNPDLVGKAAVIMDNYPYAFASYLFKVVTNSLILPEVLTTFLNSKYGRIEINKNSMKGNQTNFSPAKFKDLNIPYFQNEFQMIIQEKIQRSFIFLKKSKQIYSQAEQLLLTSLGMENFKPSTENVSVNAFSESFGSSGRIDAEYYYPKYEAYESFINCNETIQSLCNLHDSTFMPKENKEYKYIELANVGSCGIISDVEIIKSSELPSRARRKVKTGQVIISSIEGSLESCALITDEYNNAICSTGFYVLSSDSINSATLLVLFKSEPIQAMLKKRCSGTILTAITKDELLKMTLPRIEQSVQDAIATYIDKSFKLRKQAVVLLEKAKSAVEIAIEKCEEKAIDYLNESEINDI